ncbi:hypothetical protein RRG08_010234 [Elysia crispata]|uniref:Uncharacterized protein n=1 Tax=Elysia crispata TaxID=231223 RepID=A0AAE0YZN0_9GAST|nr:hypothetical protein RRG08_010234 [Elysia crispata]
MSCICSVSSTKMSFICSVSSTKDIAHLQCIINKRCRASAVYHQQKISRICSVSSTKDVVHLQCIINKRYRASTVYHQQRMSCICSVSSIAKRLLGFKSYRQKDQNQTFDLVQVIRPADEKYA